MKKNLKTPFVGRHSRKFPNGLEVKRLKLKTLQFDFILIIVNGLEVKRQKLKTLQFDFIFIIVNGLEAKRLKPY